MTLFVEQSLGRRGVKFDWLDMGSSCGSDLSPVLSESSRLGSMLAGTLVFSSSRLILWLLRSLYEALAIM